MQLRSHLQRLWCSLTAAALIPSLAWELPYTADAALKKTKTKSYLGSSGVVCLSFVVLHLPLSPSLGERVSFHCGS